MALPSSRLLVRLFAIIGMLVALVAAGPFSLHGKPPRRTQCKKTSRILAWRIANFREQRNKVFPPRLRRILLPVHGLPENIEGGKPLGVSRQGLAWGYQILPYIEETRFAYQNYED